MTEYIKQVKISAELIKVVEPYETTNNIDEATEKEMWCDLHDDLLDFLADIPKGKISLENILKKAKELHSRLSEWEIGVETSIPTTDYLPEDERDEDDFVNKDDL